MWLKKCPVLLFGRQYVTSHGLKPSLTCLKDAPFRQHIGSRMRSSIRFLDDKERAEEAVYFKHESEYLLKNLIQNHPDFNPAYNYNVFEKDYGNYVTDVNLLCQRYGWTTMPVAFVNDLEKILTTHGWTKLSK